jgi:regulator of protease activity HflC (stomatin/prohibitin superfamily)
VQQASLYDMSQKQYTMSGTSSEGARSGDDAVRARTTDGQEVRMDVTVLYSIDPDLVNTVHQRWQNRYEDDFIRPTTRGFVRDIVSAYRADDIYGEKRGEVEDRIQELLTARMAEEGLLLSDLLVRDINFSEQFTQAIEQAQIAEQEANRARLRVQQIQQEAEQARAQAEGQRDANIARAEGEAQSIILRAAAEAEGLRLVSQQIAANPALIQYQYIQQLGDNVRLITVPSNSPFLFDLEGMAESAGADFTAPPVPETQDIVPMPTPTPAPGSN